MMCLQQAQDALSSETRRIRSMVGFAPLNPPYKPVTRPYPAFSFLALRKSALMRVCQPSPVLR